MRRTSLRCLLLTVTLGVTTAAGHVSRALAQEPAPAPAPVNATSAAAQPEPFATPAPEQVKPGNSASAPELEPAQKQFAFTFNPLNLIIGRYGFNFEYQPVPHHGLIATLHYDYLRRDAGDNECLAECTETLNGGGGELGYRFYSGKQGFNGFFAGVSLLVSEHKLRYADMATAGPRLGTLFASEDLTFTGVGGAFEIGWQWQLDHVTLGGSVGLQYMKTQQVPGLGPSGSGADILVKP